MATFILDPASIDRVRWRCRRGLLELDIVLGRFIEKYADLNQNQRMVFDDLLDLPDTELWDMICGKSQLAQNEQHELLALINAA
jgi:antitoxin CptB